MPNAHLLDILILILYNISNYYYNYYSCINIISNFDHLYRNSIKMIAGGVTILHYTEYRLLYLCIIT